MKIVTNTELETIKFLSIMPGSKISYSMSEYLAPQCKNIDRIALRAYNAYISGNLTDAAIYYTDAADTIDKYHHYIHYQSCFYYIEQANICQQLRRYDEAEIFLTKAAQQDRLMTKTGYNKQIKSVIGYINAPLIPLNEEDVLQTAKSLIFESLNSYSLYTKQKSSLEEAYEIGLQIIKLYAEYHNFYHTQASRVYSNLGLALYNQNTDKSLVLAKAVAKRALDLTNQNDTAWNILAEIYHNEYPIDSLFLMGFVDQWRNSRSIRS